MFKCGSMNSSKGIRFDGKNHNWIVFENLLALPFSYLSFMMASKREDANDRNLVKIKFDPEPYNYIFNRSSSFMDSKLPRNIPRTELLNKSLSQLEKINTKNLSILHYAVKHPFHKPEYKNPNSYDAHHVQLTMRSALSIALTNDNPAGIACILNYMSKLDSDPSESFNELFSYLVQYDEFVQYLRMLKDSTPNIMRNELFFKAI